MRNLENRKIIVLGGSGFLGKAVCRALDSRKSTVFIADSKSCNLLNLEEVIKVFERVRPDYCIHCAGYNGGIEFNRMYPADILYSNACMGLNLYHASQYCRIRKLVSVMTSCAYPDTGMEVLKEDTFWNGKPNKTIRAHGVAKRVLQAASEAYYDQYEMKSVSTCITNLYGPYDTFDLVRTKVVGALIRKFVEAKQNEHDSVECWGTGSPMREFMYVDDAAEALVQVLETCEDYDNQHPLNIGTGSDVSIKDLVDIIVEEVDYEGEVVWNTKKPDGQMKKLLDSSRMREVLDVGITPLEEGIRNTVNWYIENKEQADERK